MQIHALPIFVGALCILAIGYRFYSAFIAAKVLALDAARKTPAHEKSDGKDYVPTHRWVLFGHHFAAITGAGPLIGPVLAAQFGFLPGLLWILIGVTLGGAVHDFVILSASVRRGGLSLANLARSELGPVAGAVATLATFFTVSIAISAMGFAVVKILEGSAWATFTIAMTIPIALLMGTMMRGGTPGGKAHLKLASGLGVALLFCAVVYGDKVAHSSLAAYFRFSFPTLVFLIAAYGFLASVLPVWLLLVPRDYLSAYMKLGTLFVLIVAIMFINPELKLEPLTPFVFGGGPIIKGKVFPFVFITVACGAISGFHSLIASGTTPKMIDREPDCRPIGYGAMLLEGLVAVTSLVAAACLHPADYFAINVPKEAFATLGLQPIEIDAISQLVGEELRGRTGGSVSLAAGFTQIFAQLPWQRSRTLLGYFYHFIVMFEALFILTTVDAGTRVARFLVQDLLGRVDPRFGRHDFAPGVLGASALVVFLWGGFLYTGTISTLWPMLGVANQLLATTALAIGTAFILGQNPAHRRRALLTAVPMLVLATTTLWAGWQSIFGIFLMLPATMRIQAWIDTGCTAVLMVCTLVVGASLLRVALRGNRANNIEPGAKF